MNIKPLYSLFLFASGNAFPQLPSQSLGWVTKSSALSSLKSLYEPLLPFKNGTLAVDSIHTIAYQEYGNPEGIPALFLHGGPGAGCFPRHAQFFDPRVYRIVLLDQRGSGQSQPPGEVRNNTLLHLVRDCETLRRALTIAQWGVILGGSWGSTLAVAYAQEHPSRVRSLILRGVCLLRPVEVDWLFGTAGMALQHPKAWNDFACAAGIHESLDQDAPLKRRQVLHAYYDRLLSNDPKVRLAAARSWMAWEMKVTRESALKQLNSTDSSIVLVGRALKGNRRAWGFRSPEGELLPKGVAPTQKPITFLNSLMKNLSDLVLPVSEDQNAMRPVEMVEAMEEEDIVTTNTTSLPKEYETFVPAQAMLTCFYSVNDQFAMDHLNLLDRMDKIHHIPCIAVHGGQDRICPIDTALDVATLYPQMELRVPIAAGHSMYDPAITNELVRATDLFAAKLSTSVVEIAVP